MPSPSETRAHEPNILVTSVIQQSYLLCNIINFHPPFIPIRRATPNTKNHGNLTKDGLPGWWLYVNLSNLNCRSVICFEKFRKNSTTVIAFDSDFFLNLSMDATHLSTSLLPALQLPSNAAALCGYLQLYAFYTSTRRRVMPQTRLSERQNVNVDTKSYNTWLSIITITRDKRIRDPLQYLQRQHQNTCKCKWLIKDVRPTQWTAWHRRLEANGKRQVRMCGAS
jgi:hypothetical protein